MLSQAVYSELSRADSSIRSVESEHVTGSRCLGRSLAGWPSIPPSLELIGKADWRWEAGRTSNVARQHAPGQTGERVDLSAPFPRFCSLTNLAVRLQRRR